MSGFRTSKNTQKLQNAGTNKSRLKPKHWLEQKHTFV